MHMCIHMPHKHAHNRQVHICAHTCHINAHATCRHTHMCMHMMLMCVHPCTHACRHAPTHAVVHTQECTHTKRVSLAAEVADSHHTGRISGSPPPESRLLGSLRSLHFPGSPQPQPSSPSREPGMEPGCGLRREGARRGPVSPQPGISPGRVRLIRAD